MRFRMICTAERKRRRYHAERAEVGRFADKTAIGTWAEADRNGSYAPSQERIFRRVCLVIRQNAGGTGTDPAVFDNRSMELFDIPAEISCRFHFLGL